MVNLLNQQLVWLMLGSTSLVFGVISGAKLGTFRDDRKRKLSVILMNMGVVCLSYFTGLVVVQGITFWSVTSIQDLWVLIFSSLAYMVWGTSFLVVGGYLYNLLGDLLPGLGYVKPLSPIGALVNLSPILTVSMITAMTLFAFVHQKSQLAQVVRQLWGVKYLLIMALFGVALTPIYTNAELHLYILLETYVFALFLLALASTSVVKTERLTRWLILASFWVRVIDFSYQIFTRPLLFAPQIGSLSETAVDNLFRLGGTAYGANNSSLTLITLLPFGLFQIWEARIPRWLKVLALFFLSYIVFRTDTRTAWAGYVVVLLIFFYLIKNWSYFFITIGISIGAVISLPFILAKGITNLAATGGLAGQENNLSMRISIWSFALVNALKDATSWIIGVGWAGAPVAWATFAGHAGNWGTLHNLWVSVLVYGGLIALVCWLLFFASGIRNTYLAARALPGPRNKWLFAGVAAWVGFLFFSLTANANWPQPTQMILLICVNLWCFAKLSPEQDQNV